MANEAITEPGGSRRANRLIVLPASPARLTIDKMHLLLVEKQTAFSALRTSAALLALPLAVFTVLLVASNDPLGGNVFPYAVPLLASAPAWW